jgi:hypothetical protein
MKRNLTKGVPGGSGANGLRAVPVNGRHCLSGRCIFRNRYEPLAMAQSERKIHTVLENVPVAKLLTAIRSRQGDAHDRF